MRPQSVQQSGGTTAVQRIRIWYGALLLVVCILVVRLFYLQVIKHNYYRTAANKSQRKEYVIEPERGVIEAHDGQAIVPIVLNQKLYTVFADPKYIKDASAAAAAVQKVVGGNQIEYEKLMKQRDTRYVVLAKKVDSLKAQQIDKLDLKGVGTRDYSYRTYPQGQLAAQLLGFVNDEGEGKYGIEQAMNTSLKGKTGQLKAITDASGVPLVANKDNVVIEPQAGKRLVLTIDVSMQKQLEDLLKAGLDAAKSQSGSALIIDPKTGAIKAMANYPTYNPGEFYKVTDPLAFTNGAVTAPLEVGSVMKPLTAAAALDKGVVNMNTSYYDPSRFTVDGKTITNIEEDGGAGTRNVADILQLSLNTGATWLLMQLGGGQINKLARETWHDYMTNHYLFGRATGIEQGYEDPGQVPDPNEGFGLNIQYANTSFGQGMTATILQMGAAYSAVLNGGTYYQPHLIEGERDSSGKVQQWKTKVLANNVVKPEVSRDIKQLMEYTVNKNFRTYGMAALRPQYGIGGKTGTAQIVKPGGGYYDDRFNGTFCGFVGGDDAQYVIVVRVNEPKIPGYAGARSAAPIFSNVANMLIDNFNVTPKGS